MMKPISRVSDEMIFAASRPSARATEMRSPFGPPTFRPHSALPSVAWRLDDCISAQYRMANTRKMISAPASSRPIALSSSMMPTKPMVTIRLSTRYATNRIQKPP